MSVFVNIAKQKVPLKGFPVQALENFIQWEPFKDWVQQFDREQKERENEMDISCIDVQSLDYFGSEKIGFAKFKADVKYRQTNKNAPGIVFMRGGAVSILIILRSKENTSEDKVLLTLQPRIPVPSLSFPELPAGMLDGSGNFSGTAAKEIEEETGLVVKDSELIDLTELTYGNRWKGVYPSPGGSDEFLRLFLCTKHLPDAEIKALEGKLTGLRDHGENITLKVVSLKDAYRLSPDAKLLSSLTLYEMLKRNKQLDEKC
ncbi:hypothetical protein EC973_008794 [Apophysomyces ossiformis]|uniref:Nudix hydrolase domain-containing protein n=1 Tax=Apophysomyces ossiformis TaxID=679940 RepID=A0A8H7BSG0_9FUNG|nr:hypothetical protein EC973_008794 [Apophysomyces ossiformis]